MVVVVGVVVVVVVVKELMSAGHYLCNGGGHGGGGGGGPKFKGKALRAGRGARGRVAVVAGAGKAGPRLLMHHLLGSGYQNTPISRSHSSLMIRRTSACCTGNLTVFAFFFAALNAFLASLCSLLSLLSGLRQFLPMWPTSPQFFPVILFPTSFFQK